MADEIEKVMPKATKKKSLPQADTTNKATPEASTEQKVIPSASPLDRPDPQVDKTNYVMFGDEQVEIKPTKLKYQRNRTAAFYRIVEQFPLPDLLAFDVGVLDDKRDGDAMLFDWLIAVFDDEKLVRRNYNKIDTGTVERILQIFKRLNKITDKEEAAKNRRAQAKTN